jgi:hypothetical protein
VPVEQPSDHLRPWICQQNTNDSIPGGSGKRQLADGLSGTVCEMWIPLKNLQNAPGHPRFRGQKQG